MEVILLLWLLFWRGINADAREKMQRGTPSSCSMVVNLEIIVMRALVGGSWVGVMEGATTRFQQAMRSYWQQECQPKKNVRESELMKSVLA